VQQSLLLAESPAGEHSYVKSLLLTTAKPNVFCVAVAKAMFC
jgi:hypothetical protein